MFGRLFWCSKCHYEYEAGGCGILETPTLPEARFYRAGDARGLWLSYKNEDYCGFCCDQLFPQLLEKDVTLKKVGSVCF